MVSTLLQSPATIPSLRDLGDDASKPVLTRPPALPFIGPELAALVVLLVAVHHVPGEDLGIAVLLAGSVLVPRRAALQSRLSRAGTHRENCTTVLAEGGSVLATVVVAALLVALVPGAVLWPAGAILVGDAVGLFVRRYGRRGRLVPGDAGQGAGQRPVSMTKAGRTLAAAAPSAVVATMHLLIVAGVFRSVPPQDSALLGGLLGLGAVPFVVAGTLPALMIRGLTAGRRDAVVPALLCGALAGSGAMLIVVAVPQGLAGMSDPRLGPLAPLVMVGMVTLGLGQVLVHHGVAAGRMRTPLVVTVLAVSTQLLLLSTGTGSAAEVAVDALLGGAAVLVVGLVIATSAAAPFVFRVEDAEVGDGPRLVGPVLVGLTVVGLGLRLASMRPLWIDEAGTARLAGGSFSTMLRGGLAADAHPPLFVVLAWASRQVLGDGSTVLRLPSLVAGTAIIPLLYVVGKELYGRRTGLAAAVVATVAPPLVWFSVEARPAALAALLAVASLVAALRALVRGRIRDWVLLGFTEAVLMWTHQFGGVHVVVLTLAVGAYIWRGRRDNRHGRRPEFPPLAGLLLALGIAAVATVPLLIARSGLGPPSVLPPFEFATPAAPGGGTTVFPILGTGLSALLGFHPADVTARLLALWPLGIFAALLVLGRARSRRVGLLLALAGAPFAAMFVTELAGAPRRPAFALAWAATALPMIILLVGHALSVLGGHRAKARLLTGVVAGIFLSALADQSSRVQPVPKFDVRPALAGVTANAGPRDLIAYEPRALGDLVRYEATGVRARPVDRVSGSRAVAEGDRIFVVGAFAVGSGNASVERTVNLVQELSASRPLLEERGSRDVKVWVFGPQRREVGP